MLKHVYAINMCLNNLFFLLSTCYVVNTLKTATVLVLQICSFLECTNTRYILFCLFWLEVDLICSE